MADVVYSYLERMIPDLEQLGRFEVFSQAEIKAIVKKRNHHEYALRRVGSDKEDYLRYIQYELNLNILQKKRKKRLGIMKLPETVEYHFTQRVAMIFNRMLHKFGDDVNLWLQFIDYLKKTNNAVTLNRVFAQAIQLHPTVAGLWIEAAGYEFEQNENITAARALMERALRLNPKSERLWIEFCKLECLYLMRIKERMVEYGIDASALVPKNEGIDSTSLPDAKSADAVVTNAAGDPSNQEPATTTTTPQNPFLQGAIPRFIYRSAVKAIPSDVDLRMSFLKLLGSFEETADIRQEVLDDLLRDFGNNAACVSTFAKHKLQDATDEERPEALLFAIQTFEEAIKTSPSTELWGEYLGFCVDCLDESTKRKGSAAQQREVRAWANRAVEVCQRAEEAATTSEQLYSRWIDILLNLGRVDDAVNTLENGTKRHADSASLWLLRIQLQVRRSAVTSSEVLSAEVKQLFAAAFDSVPPKKAMSLWAHFLELVLSSDMSFDVKLQHFRKALVTLSAVRDKMAVSRIKEAFISRVAATHDTQATRRAYEVGFDVPLPTEPYIRLCILIERSQRPMDLAVIRSLYRRGVRWHGRFSADLWLGFIEMEVDAGDFSAASNLYWEAKRMLRKNNTKLLAGYELLRK